MKSNRFLNWESHLIVRASEGDEVAFELISDTYRPILSSLAMRMLRNPDDASDAVQETLVKAFRALKDFDPERPLKPWLCRICANCCVDAVRTRRREFGVYTEEVLAVYASFGIGIITNIGNG